MLYVLLVLCVTGCQALWGLDHVELDNDGAAPDAGHPCNTDTFAALEGWTRHEGQGCSVGLSCGSARMRIDARALCYAEMRWSTSRVVTGSTVTVEADTSATRL